MVELSQLKRLSNNLITKNNMKNKEIGDILAEETLRVSQMEMEAKKM